MSCDKCCLFPCGRTTPCPPGQYYVFRKGKLVKVKAIELPEDVKKAVSRAILRVV